MKNYQLIGFPERNMSDFEAQFEHRLTFDPSLALGQICYAHASYVVCHHLDLMDVPNWKSHAQRCYEVVINQVDDMDHQACWFKPLSLTMLCGTYASLWRELASLSASNFYMFEEDYLGTTPQELQFILLEVLYSLSSDPPERSREAQKALNQITNKKAQRYIDLWRAVESDNQDQFETILIDSLARFSRRKKPPADATFPLEWIALFESIVANFAVHRGMRVPALPKKQQPLLMVQNRD